MKKTYYDSALFHSAVRIGKGRKPIVTTKFRTMNKGAHSKNREIFGSGDQRHIPHKVYDPRVITIGRFLRKYQLDEIPQIVSWLKGEIRLIGIRPQIREVYQKYPEDIKRIYDEMGPGLLGVFYACKPFPPTREAELEEYRKFYGLWKKNKAKSYLTYARKILANRIRGKGWSR